MNVGLCSTISTLAPAVSSINDDQELRVAPYSRGGPHVPSHSTQVSSSGLAKRDRKKGQATGGNRMDLVVKQAGQRLRQPAQMLA